MFNNKKDPLVDAVRGIMEASAREREIERKLNESLGITSKKALPHELHSEYDAVLKESIAGSQINEVSEKLLKRAKQKAKDNAMVAWELNDKKAEDKNEKRAKKFSKAIKKKMEEEKELSPKQKKLAAKAGDEDEIEAVDLAALRKDKTLDEAKATEAQKEKVAKVMHKWKQGKEHIGKSDKTVPVTKKGQKQAVAIALSQAGLSKKMDESNSFNLVQEEIRTNLLERIRHIYESEGADAANAYFETLSEEERGILDEQSLNTQPQSGVHTPYSGRFMSGLMGMGDDAMLAIRHMGKGAKLAFQDLRNITPNIFGKKSPTSMSNFNLTDTPTGTSTEPATQQAAQQATPIAQTAPPAVKPRIRDAAYFKSPITGKYKYDYTTPDGERTNGAIEGRYAGRSAARVLTHVQQKRVEKSGEVKHAIRAVGDAESQWPDEADKTISKPTPRPVNSDREEDQTSTATAAQPETQASTPAPRPVPGAQTAVPGAQTAPPAASTDSGTSPMARPASAPRPARPAPTSDWKKDVFDSTKIGGA